MTNSQSSDSKKTFTQDNALLFMIITSVKVSTTITVQDQSLD